MITAALVGVLAVVFAVYVWPTPYREYRFKQGDRIIRVNRFTGHASVLFDVR